GWMLGVIETAPRRPPSHKEMKSRIEHHSSERDHIWKFEYRRPLERPRQEVRCGQHRFRSAMQRKECLQVERRPRQPSKLPLGVDYKSAFQRAKSGEWVVLAYIVLDIIGINSQENQVTSIIVSLKAQIGLIGAVTADRIVGNAAV